MLHDVKSDNVNQDGRNENIKHAVIPIFVMYRAVHVGDVGTELRFDSVPVDTPLVRQAGQLFLPT